MSNERVRRPGSARVFDRGDFLRVLLAGGATALGVGACGDSGSDDSGAGGTGGKGGSGTGGKGGSGTGGSGTGGSGTGGSGTGGSGTGGSGTGGSGTGGSGTGGSGTGGSGTGGSGTGGSGTGGASGSGTGGGGGGCAQQIDAQITCRTGHSLIVTVADLTAGVAKTYDIRGANASHGHMVTVTAALFARLRAGETVQIAVASSTQPHTIYLSCAGLDAHARDEEACNN